MTDKPIEVTEVEAEFQREERYIVVKLDYLTEGQEFQIKRFLATKCEQPDRKYAVIEDDWPEYETVWAMIEARCTGNPAPSYQALTQQLEEAREERDALLKAATDIRGDLLMRAKISRDGSKVVDAGNGVWVRLNDAIDALTTKADGGS